MTSEERNRRLKYGHEVPRSWIPEFNVPPRSVRKVSLSDWLGPSRHLLRRRREDRKVLQLNRDIRRVQWLLATLIVGVCVIQRGVVGLAVGLVISLLLMVIRLEL